jgi:hypothetical protein
MSDRIQVFHSSAPSRSLDIWSPTKFMVGYQLYESYPISDEMCDFLKIPHGTERSIKELSSGVIQYCKSLGLMNGIKIVKDDTLISLLNLTPKDNLSVLHLERHLYQHFILPAEQEFITWWLSRKCPSLVSVNASRFNGNDISNLQDFMVRKRYSMVKFMLYLDLAVDEGCAPCGCETDSEKCYYHAFGNEDTAECGCSKLYKVICAFHAKH